MTENGRYGPKLTITADWSPVLLDVIRKEHIQEIVLSKSGGFARDNLDFLVDIPWIQSFTLLDLNTKDVQGIHYLKNLRFLHLSDYSGQEIEFSVFPQLEECYLEFNKKRKSIAKCGKLLHLSLQHFAYKDLEVLRPLSNLQSLSIAQGSLSDLSGIGEFTNLKELRIVLQRNLRNISPLAESEGLEIIDLQCCRIGNLNALSRIAGLRWLNIEDCGPLESLSPLLACKNLERLSFGGTTDILDGNTQIIGRMPKLRVLEMQNRRHYNAKREDLPVFYFPFPKEWVISVK